MSDKPEPTAMGSHFIPAGFGDMTLEWEIAELENDLMEVADSLDPRALKAIQFWMQGHVNAEAVMLAGYNQKDYSDAGKHFLFIIRKPQAKMYVDLCKRIAMMRSLREEAYTEAEWMRQIRRVQTLAMGDEAQNMSTFHEGGLVTGKGKNAQLGQAIKALELVGKRHGWLVDKSEVKNTGDAKVVVSVKDFTRKHEDEDDEDE